MTDTPKPKRGTRSATRRRLWQLFTHNTLDAAAWERSKALAGLVPTREDWRRFIDLLLLALGTVFLLAGILFFFAFNWADLPRIAKFAIVEGAVIIAVVAAFLLDIDTWSGRLALVAASILVGVALGVVGTTYQTGADSYNLFVVWAMLVTGWALISQWNVMYLIWLVLVNTACSLYWAQVIGGDWLTLNLILLAINGAFVLVWELLAYFDVVAFVKRGRWLLYVVMLAVLAYATYIMLDWIFVLEFSDPAIIPVPLIYGIVMGALLVWYTRLCPDLLMLTMGAISLLIVLVSSVGRLLDDLFVSNWTVFFCVMGIVTISITGGLVFVLRWLQTAWEIDE